MFLASGASQYICGELLVVDGVSKFALKWFLFVSCLFESDSSSFRDGWADDRQVTFFGISGICNSMVWFSMRGEEKREVQR